MASVDVDEFVYVFLNEVPREELFFGAEKIFYTRIGRICKVSDRFPLLFLAITRRPIYVVHHSKS